MFDQLWFRDFERHMESDMMGSICGVMVMDREKIAILMKLPVLEDQVGGLAEEIPVVVVVVETCCLNWCDGGGGGGDGGVGMWCGGGGGGDGGVGMWCGGDGVDVRCGGGDGVDARCGGGREVSFQSISGNML